MSYRYQAPCYPAAEHISPDNVEWFVYAHEGYLDPGNLQLRAAELLALKLALFFHERNDLARMTQFIALAMQHHEDRTRDNPHYQRLDIILKDPGFAWLFRKFGYMMCLGPIIADPTITHIYIPPKSVLDSDVAALTHVLNTKPNIQLLDLANQHIGNDGACLLAETLRDHPSIKKVYLNDNKINSKGQEALATVPKHVNIVLGNQHTRCEPRRNRIF